MQDFGYAGVGHAKAEDVGAEGGYGFFPGVGVVLTSDSFARGCHVVVVESEGGEMKDCGKSQRQSHQISPNGYNRSVTIPAQTHNDGVITCE